ncbi:hypothetical protein LCI18_003257 [Fusarium solani-melongenae]|uniref:Uncharacterized protein n=1 Tax=Fusarium solani subsp. cucurbitae TaxID=2747967 RepID=A0ACD3YTM0_FUSSC|nr:hypothetical protein LCI18_003257 [Fusarium solani-melongenae]
MNATSNILLIGGGGLGVIAALSLEGSGRARVTAALRSNYDIVKTKGYTIRSCDHGEINGWRPTTIVNHVPRVTSHDKSFDYIVITTKNVPGVGQDMAELIEPAVSPGITVIVLIQNGLNIERPYLEQYPGNIILSGVSFAGSQEVTPGTIEHGSHDHLLLGAFRNPNVDVASGEAAAMSFVSLYAASGRASCFYTADTMSHRWRKLVYNATMNPLCAITNLDSGSLRQSGSGITKLINDAMGEILAASTASGYVLPLGTAQDLLSLDAPDEHFEPSMLQDVRKGNLIEYEYLVGEPMREGLRLGVQMPTISTLYALCQAVQNRMEQQRKI